MSSNKKPGPQLTSGIRFTTNKPKPVTQEAKDPVVAPVETPTAPVQAPVQASVATPQATPVASSGLANNEAKAPLVKSKTISSKKKVARGKARNKTILSSPYGANKAETKKKTLLGQ
jgi:hypothetical protein